MNKKLFITIGIIIGLAVLVGFIFWPRLKPKPLETPPVTQGTGGPSVTNPPPQSPGGKTDAAFSLRTADGGSIRTKNFKQDPETVKDPINAGYYYLGYHLTGTPGEKVPYVIMYIDATQYFNIVLLQEPIGQVRRAAERYLMEHLGISQAQMCQLQYTVAVPDSVSAIYTTLGFSFCPESVVIPE